MTKPNKFKNLSTIIGVKTKKKHKNVKKNVQEKYAHKTPIWKF